MENQPIVNSIILAAGAAKRMGQTKQLLKLQNKTLLEHVINQTLIEKFTHVNTVIGHDAKAIQESISIKDNRFKWVKNHAYQNGLSTSFKKGLQCLPKNTNAHVMVFLADMPFIKQTTIHRIFNQGIAIAKEKHNSFILRPIYEGGIGHPVFLGHMNKKNFDPLNGDDGAKGIFQNINHVKELTVEDEGVIWDIDTIEAYEAAKNRTF